MNIQFQNPRYTILAQLFVVVLFVAVLLFCHYINFNISTQCDFIQIKQSTATQTELRIKEISNEKLLSKVVRTNTKVTFDANGETLAGNVCKYYIDECGSYILVINSQNTLVKSKYFKGDLIVNKSLLSYIVDNVFSK